MKQVFYVSLKKNGGQKNECRVLWMWLLWGVAIWRVCCDIDSKYAHDYDVKCDGTKEQADEHGFDVGDYEVGDVIDDSGIDSKHCPFCSGNKVHDEDLLSTF